MYFPRWLYSSQLHSHSIWFLFFCTVQMQYIQKRMDTSLARKMNKISDNTTLVRSSPTVTQLLFS